MIESVAWVLPRPRRANKYIGCFPEHFEKRLLRMLNVEVDKFKVLHPFGGKAEYGLRVDIKADVVPEVRADAHLLPFKDNIFNVVILDPPYNEEYSKRLYGTKKPRFKTFVTEAVRVLKEEGYLVVYHYLATPRIENTVLVKRIFLETRVWHKLRCIHIHQKNSSAWSC